MHEVEDALAIPTETRFVEAAAYPAKEINGSRVSAYSWYVVGLLAVVNAINYMDRSALSVLSPLIKADLKISDGQLGLLTGLAFFLFYAFCGIPIARWSDRGVRRNIIALSMVMWSVITALSGMVQNVGQLFLSRVGVGIGEAGSLPAGSSIISDYIPPPRRASAYAIQTLGLLSGTMLGLGVAGAIGESFGWRAAFVVLGIPGVLVAIVVRLSLREPLRGRLDSGQVNIGDVSNCVPSLVETIRILWFRRTYRFITLFAVVNGFVQCGLSQWWPSFYVRSYGFSVSVVGSELGIAIGAGSALGLLLGGLIGDKLTPRNARLPLLVGAISVLFSLPILAVSLFAHSASTSLTFVGLAWVFWCIPYGATSAASVGAVDPRMRATGGALSAFATSVLGLGFGPSCVGVLSNFLTGAFGGEALRYALLLPISVIPVMSIMLFKAAKSLSTEQAPRD